jgi:hypothetical protein
VFFVLSFLNYIHVEKIYRISWIMLDRYKVI